MKQQTALHLPVDVYSPDQLNSLMIELQAYRGQLRDAAVRAKVSHTKETPQLSELLKSLLNSCNVQPTDSQGLETLQKQLEDILKTAPTVHITLAAMASRTLKRQITVWFRTQVHPSVLLTFAARGDIGGGLIMQAGSHLYDYSFREAILANKKRLGEIAGV